MEKGRVVHSPLFLLRYSIENGSGGSKFAAVAPQKVAKKATERNKIRRKIYEAVKFNYSKVKNDVKGAIFAKKKLDGVDFDDLAEEIKQLFVKAAIMK